ncbi:PAS domain-containing protein [Tardiphaga alba]|uniref:PAS domain-containing protein n=1 Tax=Tardiphaga alba TaxID=340268 RepID=A0ABX8ACE9_9BRAD|nr:PAS domain-containing protein [Tardiphaga alba]QUS40646.1 PAS domain-containing protein [Tardiphaga alba]
MKHPSSRKFFAYWDEKRGFARAPDRSEIEPGPVRELLGDIFVLGYDKPAGFPFRVAGTRVCAMFGRDLKSESFPQLFGAAGRSDIEEMVTVVSEELLVAVAGVTAHTETGDKAHLEMMLLPFAARAHTPISLTGLLASMTPVIGRLGPLEMTSFRYLAHQPQRFAPRILRKLQAARGLMVYEGLS